MQKDEQACEICGNKAHQVHHKDNNHKNNEKENLQPLCTLCHAKVHGIEPNKSELKELVILRDRAIRIRNALDNQIRGFGRIEYAVPEYWSLERKQFDSKIKEFEKAIKKKMTVENHPIFEWLGSIKGIGTITAAKLIAYIDIKKTPSISALWRYCGLDATHIKRKKKITKVEAAKFGNPYLKKELLGIISDNFIRKRTPLYYNFYREEKAKLLELMNSQTENETPPKPASIPQSKMHCHLRAKRKTVKLFLSHFWLMWRRAENLPISKSYAEAILNHKHIIEPIAIRGAVIL